MKEGNQPLLSLTIAGVSSPNASSIGSPPSTYPAPAPLSDFLERVFESPYPTAQGISSYLDIEDIINLRNTCKLHQANIQDKGRWAWLLNRLSTRQVDYPNPDPRIRRLSLGVPPSSREGYVGGREFVIIDVSAGDRDFLKLNSRLYNIGAFETLTSLILDGTNIDAGDVGHLLRKLQNITTLSLRHCWNVNLQLLYKLFKKTSEAHIEEVNYFNGINQERSKSKCPAEQIHKLRIWDIDGIQMLGNAKALIIRYLCYALEKGYSVVVAKKTYRSRSVRSADSSRRVRFARPISARIVSKKVTRPRNLNIQHLQLRPGSHLNSQLPYVELHNANGMITGITTIQSALNSKPKSVFIALGIYAYYSDER
ncbi:uncharacterized protein DFL_000570 [Arthrobotrys flagrans]|uniref:F-box domain-containing protein n=1 Tax=Arthrobotrys flagrans TaxID=97331 RepID=A0A437AFB9_ARTFL|nr:hypothetical protein DFL_000570 [Arthrobotrys flagrans]